MSKLRPARYIAIGLRPLTFALSGMMPGEVPVASATFECDRITTRSAIARDRRRATALRWSAQRARRRQSERGQQRP